MASTWLFQIASGFILKRIQFPVSPGYLPQVWRSLLKMLRIGSAPLSLTLTRYTQAQRRISQHGQINWTRWMETCVWCKNPVRMRPFIALIGKIMTVFKDWRPGTPTRYSLLLRSSQTIHPSSHPSFQSFISCCTLFVVCINPSPPLLCVSESCGEDGYQDIFPQVLAAGAALHGGCAVGDPEPRGWGGEELRRQPAGVRGEGVRHRHRSADSNLR